MQLDRVNDPIAIVGVGCRFPGDITSPEQLWSLLVEGRDAIGEVPPERWSLPVYFHPDPARPGRSYAKWGGFLRDVDQFDAAFFSISAREAAKADPQQRLLLEVAYEALEDGGVTLESIAGRKGGVFIGIASYDYGGMQCSQNERNSIDAYTNLGSALSIAANRISYAFDLHGPSLAVDTACSSSLVATHLACQSIWNGECEFALSGGVSLMLRPEPTIGFSKASMLAPDGRCKSFDAAANGYARAEGAAAVLLKPLSRALADRDPVYAVIRATAVNQDGRTGGISVPSADAQAAMLADALAAAAIPANSIQYVEAHGTGTPVGDPIEAAALGRVLGLGRPPERYCLIGSIKSHFGHPEAASGVAGLIKAALCVQRGQIPPNLHITTPNPNIPFEDLGLCVANRLIPWPDTQGGPRRAGVNSFGFGGTNAHAVLEAAPERPPVPAVPETGRLQLVPLSARSPEALRALAEAYTRLLSDDDAPSLTDVRYTASLRRSHHDHRLAVLARDDAELVESLRAFLVNEARPGLSTGRASGRPRPVFVCSGMGQQWWAMGRQLLAEERVYANCIDRTDALLQPLTGWSLREVLSASEADSIVRETRVAQPAIFATQIGLAALWREWGVEPAAVVGHSVGEVAAAYIAGALSLEDAVQVIFHRSRLQQRTAGQGSMLAVGFSAADAERWVDGRHAAVSIAAINSARSVTLSGDRAELDAIARLLEADEVFCRFLDVEVPYHSPRMDPLRGELLESLASLRPVTAPIALYSTVLGRRATGDELDAGYWWLNLRSPVRFHAAMIELLEAGHGIFLEIGAHPVLRPSIAECLAEPGRKGAVIASLRRREPERATMLSALGQLYTLGVAPSWERFHGAGGTFVRLPRYPWQREPFWHESERTRQERLGERAHVLLGRREHSAHPRWHLELDLATLPYLGDHRVQGAAVYPAAGIVEMGLAVARELFGAVPCVLEEVTLHKALFVPEKEAVATEVFVDPTRNRFEVATATPGTPGMWTIHAEGKVRVLGPSPTKTITVDEIRARCGRAVERPECYRRFAAVGLDYGPAFQGLKRIWCGAREALAEIVLAADLHATLSEYRLHPAALDAAFQTLLGALAGEAEDAAACLYLPVGIEQLTYRADGGARLWSHARLTELSRLELKGDIIVADETGLCVAEIRGFVCRAIDRDADPVGGTLYEYEWKLLPKTAPSAPLRSAAHLPTPSTLAPVLAVEAEALRHRWSRDEFHGTYNQLFRELGSAYVTQALRQLGWDRARDAKLSPPELAERLGVVPEHRRLFDRILGALTPADFGSDRNPEVVWKQIWDRYPAGLAELTMIRSCGLNLASVLRGTSNPIDLIFPEGSSTTAEHLYQDSPGYRVYNLLLQRAVRALAHRLSPGRVLSILEIGGGTGGLCAYLLPELAPLRTQYTFTDISPLLVSQAERTFGQYPFVQYRTLDIENDPVGQGLPLHAFDVILASDVLHATRDLRHTLDHVKRLLASEGTLLLLEGVKAPLSVILVFGLLKGWWLFDDTELRTIDPWISQDAWRKLLGEVGFSDPMCVSDAPDADQTVHAVIVARGPRVTADVPVDDSVDNAAGTWLLFVGSEDTAGGPDTGVELAARLRERGARTLLVSPGERFAVDDGGFRVRPGSRDDVERLLGALPVALSEITGVVHLWAVSARPGPDARGAEIEAAWRPGLMSVTTLVQGLTKVSGRLPSLWVVTCRAQSVGDDDGDLDVSHAPLWGLGRVVATECQQLRCHLVDLGTGSAVELEGLVADLLSEDDEDELAYRGEARYARRLVHGSRVTTARANGDGPLCVEPLAPGILDSLAARAIARRSPGPGEIEVEVVAAALNFKDVMMALALLPPEATRGGFSGGRLGLEFSGRVSAVGSGVNGLRAGDPVFACGSGCLATHLTIDHRFVMPIPTGLDFEAAATIPVAYLTAYYALHTLARLERGERVLIHAATGGVGLAAIQLAQHAGAEVFATAGSGSKRELLHALGVRHVMDSRSLAFAEEVLERTGGEGIDVVLNSLSGDAIAKSLAVLRPYGRFVEIGKRDIYEGGHLPLRPFGENLAYFAVDLDRLGAQRPDLLRSVFRQLFDLLEKGDVRPLPYRLFPLARVTAAFRHMAQARHVGKVVIAMSERAGMPVVPERKRVRLRQDATYLVTGGLGGFGLAVAGWLVERGARHLVLIGRQGAAMPEAQAAVQALEHGGVSVRVGSADVTREADLAALLECVRREMPPLRGVVHAAMVLDDALLENMTEPRIRSALLPKAVGAWHLHRLTLGDPLDLFVLFSSFTSLIGNPGQANYVAGNAFLDALAPHRRQRGLPALTINWGAVAGVGYVARNREIEGRVEQLGMKGQPVRQMLSALEQLLENGTVQAGVAQIDWQRVKRLFGVRVSPRFSNLVTSGAESSVGDMSLRAILDADPARRPALLAEHIREHLARVLGTSPSRLDPDQSLLTLGLDSLMAVEMRNRIQLEMGVDVPPVKFMEGVSIAGVAAFVADRLTVMHPAASGRPGPATTRKGQSETFRGAPAPAETALPESVARLSDDEVDRLLRKLVV